MLFHNDRTGGFSNGTAAAGSGFSVPHLGRGAAFADFNNNGRMDIVVGNNDDPPSLLTNSGGPNHFVSIKLIGSRSNRDAIGARVRVRSNGVTQLREIQGGGSYLSQSDLRAHFGLGAFPRIDFIEVGWPGSAHQRFQNVKADQFYTLEEGTGSLHLDSFQKSAGKRRAFRAQAIC